MKRVLLMCGALSLGGLGLFLFAPPVSAQPTSPTCLEVDLEVRHQNTTVSKPEEPVIVVDGKDSAFTLTVPDLTTRKKRTRPSRIEGTVTVEVRTTRPRLRVLLDGEVQYQETSMVNKQEETVPLMSTLEMESGERRQSRLPLPLDLDAPDAPFDVFLTIRTLPSEACDSLRP